MEHGENEWSYINELGLGPIHDGYEHVTCENEKNAMWKTQKKEWKLHRQIEKRIRHVDKTEQAYCVYVWEYLSLA